MARSASSLSPRHSRTRKLPDQPALAKTPDPSVTESSTAADPAVERARSLGCLLGGAVGDALGAAVTHDPLAEIHRRFGPAGLRDYAPAHGGLGRLTDHTQMTLFTAEGLIRTMVASVVQGEADVLAGVGRALLRWYHTQTEYSALTREADLAGWLFPQRALHTRRSSAPTCMEVLRNTRQLDTPAENHSKDCGALTRSAPVGLLAHSAILSRDPADTFDLGVSIARLTHGHPDGVLPAGVLTLLVLQLLGGRSLREALETALPVLTRQFRHQPTAKALTLALSLADSASPPAECIARLGAGWVAEEALGVAVYCALVAETFEQGVLLAVNHDGNSSATAALTGHLLGAALGMEAIPSRWLAPLELREVITEIAGDVYDWPQWELGDDKATAESTQRLWEKYPG